MAGPPTCLPPCVKCSTTVRARPEALGTLRRGRRMRVDVADLAGCQARLPQCTLHRQLRADAIGGRLRDVVRIARQAVAPHLRRYPGDRNDREDGFSTAWLVRPCLHVPSSLVHRTPASEARPRPTSCGRFALPAPAPQLTTLTGQTLAACPLLSRRPAAAAPSAATLAHVHHPTTTDQPLTSA